MEPAKSIWLWLLALLGFVVIYLGFRFGSPDRSRTDQLSQVGWVELHTGEADLLSEGGLAKKPILSRLPVSQLESVETKDLGEARIEFVNSGRIRIKEHSLVTFERIEGGDEFHIVMLIKKGQIAIEDPGQAGDLFVAKNGERIAAQDYEKSQLAQQIVLEDSSKSEDITELPADAPLNETEIQEKMQQIQSSFMRCYTQLLQKDPAAKGQAQLIFTVRGTGEVLEATVESAQLKDAAFKSCLAGLVKKVKFRQFKGEPISTLFPLRFE